MHLIRAFRFGAKRVSRVHFGFRAVSVACRPTTVWSGHGESDRHGGLKQQCDAAVGAQPEPIRPATHSGGAPARIRRAGTAVRNCLRRWRAGRVPGIGARRRQGVLFLAARSARRRGPRPEGRHSAQGGRRVAGRVAGRASDRRRRTESSRRPSRLSGPADAHRLGEGANSQGPVVGKRSRARILEGYDLDGPRAFYAHDFS